MASVLQNPFSYLSSKEIHLEKLKKIWPFLASLGGASVMVLAFFIPSLQDQWDRYQSRKVIEQYEELGDDFFSEEHFEMAEEAYAKAYELSDSKRLDIELKRLSAKVNRIGSDPNWGSKPPEGLHDIDFQFLLHFQKGEDKEKHRLSTLNCYGVFLSSAGRPKEAEEVLKEALKLDSTFILALVNLGNLYGQQGNMERSEQCYKKAISLEPDNARAHYNLGLLFAERGEWVNAGVEFSRAVELDPEDADAKTENDLMQHKIQTIKGQ